MRYIISDIDIHGHIYETILFKDLCSDNSLSVIVPVGGFQQEPWDGLEVASIPSAYEEDYSSV